MVNSDHRHNGEHIVILTKTHAEYWINKKLARWAKPLMCDDDDDGFCLYTPSIDQVVNQHLPPPSHEQKYKDGVLRDMMNELLYHKHYGIPEWFGTLDGWLEHKINTRTVGFRYPGNNVYEINTAKRLKRKLERSRLRK